MIVLCVLRVLARLGIGPVLRLARLTGPLPGEAR
jgi:hypothetical protein